MSYLLSKSKREKMDPKIKAFNNLPSIAEEIESTESESLNEQKLELATEDTFEGIFGDVFTRENVLKIPYVDEIERELIGNEEPKVQTMCTVYQINDSFFVEKESMLSDDEELLQYEVYKEERNTVNGLCSDDEDMSEEVPLEVIIQKVPNGLIINSNVYLSEAQWHTISGFEELFCCDVCQVYCDKVEIEAHVKTKSHESNLNKCPPIRHYDLSIVRKIRNSLHCGVCNESFTDAEFKDHENTKSHEGNLLEAINKVSDLMYDSNMKENQFDSVSPNRNILTERFLASESNRQAERDIARNNQAISQNNQTVSQNNQTVSRNNQIIYGRFDRSASVDSSLDNRGFPELRKNNNNVYFNANISVYDDYSDNEEYMPPQEGVSYACMASKPRVELPKYLKIDLGTKEVRVKFESWHMLITPEKNKFYCMACGETDMIRNKGVHVSSQGHKERLDRCSVLAAYDSYLIRMVNDKLYHCGHCNNLQYNHQMIDHIEAVHPKKAKIIDTTAPTNQIIFDKLKSEPKKLDVPIETSEGSVFGDITIAPFGYDVKIATVSYNTVIDRDGKCYCAVCDTVCSDVKAHVEDLKHKEFINMTPFIRMFKSHLTRSVRGTLHCALCNELIQVANIYIHNVTPEHTSALACALGMKNKQVPEKTKKSAKNSTTDVKIANAETDFSLALKDALESSKNSHNVDPTSNRAVQSEDLNGSTTDKTSKLRNNQFRTQNFDLVQNQSNLLKSGQTSQPGHSLLTPGQNLGQSQSVGPNQSDNIRAANHLLHLPTTQSQTPTMQTSQTHLLVGAPLRPVAKPRLAQTGQNFHRTGPNLLQTGPNLLQTGPNLLQTGPNFLQTGPNLLHTGPHCPTTLPNLPVSGQPLPNFVPTPLYLNTYRFPGQNPLLCQPPINQNLLIPGQNSFNYPNISNFNPNPYFNHASVPFRPNTPNSTASKENIPAKNSIKSPVLNIGDTVKKDTELVKNPTKTVKVDSKPAKAQESIKSDSCQTAVKDVKVTRKFSVNLSESDEEEIVFDEEEYILLTLKTAFFKVTNLSFNTLVYVDNGVRHCFVCSSLVKYEKFQQHIDSREHTKNMKKTKFLDKYSGQLFRQMYLMYHCTVCNVLMSNKEIKTHLDWGAHNEIYQTSYNINNKKNKKVLKSGLKVYPVESQKESIYHNVSEPCLKVMYSYQINPDFNAKDTKPKPTKTSSAGEMKKVNKLVIYQNSLLKIPHDHWNGIATQINQTKCLLCECKLKPDQIAAHWVSDYHTGAVESPFHDCYYPALIRKTSLNNVHCLFCNSNIPNNKKMIMKHIEGRKHTTNHEDVLKQAAISESFLDCSDDIFYIEE